MNLIRYLLLLILISTVATVTAQQKCKCEGNVMQKLWLDVIFVVDVSDSLKSSFEGVKQMILTFVSFSSIGQEGAKARVAVITFSDTASVIADLGTFKSKSEARDVIKAKLVHTGGSTANLRLGLAKAQDIIRQKNTTRHNARKLIILVTTHGFLCPDSIEEGTNTYPCLLANNLRAEGHIILGVAIKIAGENRYPSLETLVTPCFLVVNNIYLFSNISNMACLANCFCQYPLQQFVNENKCEFYDECVYRMQIPVGYYAAQNGCQHLQMSLADIRSEEKQKFLDSLSDVPHTPYWTGMTYDKQTNQLSWDSNDEMYCESDQFGNWMEGDLKNGCPANILQSGVAQEKSTKTVWRSDECSWDQPSYYYFCQKSACSIDNYCDSKML